MPTTVFDVLRDSAQAPLPGVAVKVELMAGDGPASVPTAPGTILEPAELVTDGAGRWQVDLVPNGLILPPGTHYRVTGRPAGFGVHTQLIVVPNVAGVLWAGALLVEPAPARQPPVPIGYLAGGGFVTGQLYVQDTPPPPEVVGPGVVWVNTSKTL